MKFTEIPDKLKYPSNIRAKLSTLHSSVVTYVSEHFERRYDYRKKVISIMNTLSYIVVSGESIPSSWQECNPLNHIDIVEDDLCKSTLGDIYLSEKNVVWDVIPCTNIPPAISIAESTKSPYVVTSSTEKSDATRFDKSNPIKVNSVVKPTPKEDLYIRPPIIPQFDVNRPWVSGVLDGELYVIYSSLPEIPTKQNEISATTDVNKITSPELMNLYPNRFIRTRASCMYEPISGLEYDEDLGVIFPIEGYTFEEIKDNIIKYPHIFKLTRLVDDQIVSMYTTIEIDGQLFNISDVWNTLPESRYIPRTSEFVKEYVVRRYLLERDIRGIDHKYPLYGSLDPFLTLFTTPDDYIRLGYTDIIGIARQCVLSRVNYKQTRNPVLRRLNNA